MPNSNAVKIPTIWEPELKLNPVPPTPLVILASLVLGAIGLLVVGVVANNRLPALPEQPVFDQTGSDQFSQ